MRSEADIRRQVEARFHRWVLLILNGGGWVAVTVGLYLYSRYQDVPVGWTGSAFFVLLLWGILVGLHFLRTIYVETREWLVRRAIDREMRAHPLYESYPKRKRDETPLGLTDEGELIDFVSEEDTYAQRG